MNERINQLAEEAGIAIWGDAAYMYHPKDTLDSDTLKKFAELIVAECTAALFDESERLSGLYSDEDNWDSAEEYEIRSNQCIDDIALIEKHFGVEE
jgi:hypothetical protein